MQRYVVDTNLDGKVMVFGKGGEPADLSPGDAYYGAQEADAALAAKDAENNRIRHVLQQLLIDSNGKIRADHWNRAMSALEMNNAPSEAHRDTARLDWIDSECADLRCQVHRYQDDSDTYYQVVTFHMDAPKERCVGEGSDPRTAIDVAMAGAAKPEIKVLERDELPLNAPEQPYVVQGFWSPCRKYIASVHLSDGEITVQDDEGVVWEPTGTAEDIANASQSSSVHPDSARLDKLQEENTGLRLIVAALKRTKMHGPKCICTNCETLNAHQEPKP